MGLLDGLIGAILLATIISTILFGILTVQTQSYFSRFPNDPRWVKLMVAFLWIVDGAHQIFTCIFIYDYTITHFLDPEFLSHSSVPLSGTVTLEPIPAVIVQLYFARRLYLLNKQWWPVVVAIVLMSLAAFGFGAYCGIVIYRLTFLSEFHKFTWAVTAWLITSCVCDIVIAGSIAYQLWTSRSGFKPTDKLLATLTLWTVNTGVVPAAFALTDAVTFVKINDSLVHLAFNIMLAKLYSNTALGFLNRRRTDKRFEPRGNAGNGPTGDIRMATFGSTSTGTKTFNVTNGIARRDSIDPPPVRFEVSKQQFVEQSEDPIDFTDPVDYKHLSIDQIAGSYSPRREPWQYSGAEKSHSSLDLSSSTSPPRSRTKQI